MPTALARSAASRITLTRALVALGAVLVGINVASAIWDARTDRDRTELRARRDLSNLTGLLSEQTAAALEAVLGTALGRRSVVLVGMMGAGCEGAGKP